MIYVIAIWICVVIIERHSPHLRNEDGRAKKKHGYNVIQSRWKVQLGDLQQKQEVGRWMKRSDRQTTFLLLSDYKNGMLMTIALFRPNELWQAILRKVNGRKVEANGKADDNFGILGTTAKAMRNIRALNLFQPNVCNF